MIHCNGSPSSAVCAQWSVEIPLTREVHIWSIWLEVFDEADSDDVALTVFEEEADALETTCITSPVSGTRDAA